MTKRDDPDTARDDTPRHNNTLDTITRFDMTSGTATSRTTAGGPEVTQQTPNSENSMLFKLLNLEGEWTKKTSHQDEDLQAARRTIEGWGAGCSYIKLLRVDLFVHLPFGLQMLFILLV